MDKRKEANLRVKNAISEALLALMHEKSFSEISITEIIERAGVARASFYRNYESKEDVLHKLIDDILDKFYKDIDWENSEYYTYRNVCRSFAYFKRFRRYIEDFYRFGDGITLLEKLNESHEIIAGTMKISSIERYNLYMYIGALYNTALVWINNGMRESVEDISKMFCGFVGIEPEEDCNPAVEIKVE